MNIVPTLKEAVDFPIIVGRTFSFTFREQVSRWWSISQCIASWHILKGVFIVSISADLENEIWPMPCLLASPYKTFYTNSQGSLLAIFPFAHAGAVYPFRISSQQSSRNILHLQPGKNKQHYTDFAIPNQSFSPLLLLKTPKWLWFRQALWPLQSKLFIPHGQDVYKTDCAAFSLGCWLFMCVQKQLIPPNLASRLYTICLTGLGFCFTRITVVFYSHAWVPHLPQCEYWRPPAHLHSHIQGAAPAPIFLWHLSQLSALALFYTFLFAGFVTILLY